MLSSFRSLLLPRSLGILLVISAFSLELLHTTPTWLQRLNYLLYDLRFAAATQVHSGSENPFHIAIVDIDEASLAQEGRWPWSRARLAELVENIAAAGALVVGFDVVFSEAERNPVDELQKRIPDAQHLPEAWRILSDGDQHFANSFSATDTVLGFFFMNEPDIRIGQRPESIYDLPKLDATPWVITEKPGFVSNLEKLQQRAQGGFVTTFTDMDGVVRRTPLVIQQDQQLYPALSLAMAMSYLLTNTVQLDAERVGNVMALRALSLGEHPARTDAVGQVIVPYKGGQGAFPYYSAADILNKTMPPNALAESLVLIGTSSIGLADLQATPVGNQYPGVEVHANVLEGLLTGNFPYQPEWHAGLTLFSIFLIGILLAWYLPALKPLSTLALSLSSIAFVIGSNFYAWFALRLDLSMATLLLLTLALATFNLAYGFITESRSRQQLRGMFDQYVPPAHIERMLKQPDDVHLSGESKELSVLFSDIRSFTSISETLSASELKSLLNEYFNPITRSIFDHEGTVDKYVGDMVMAFWGAPLEDAHHAHHAVACALDMQAKLIQLRQQFSAKHWPEIHAGIGINTGIMNVGDMGSHYRRAYTVLGDAVNLGARLESLSKYYGVNILVGEQTRAQAPSFAYRFIDRITVKGKVQPVDIYEPLGWRAEISAPLLQEISSWEDVLHCYRQQHWRDAQHRLLKLQQQQSRRLYALYLERLEPLCSLGFIEHWDGVFKHEHK